MSVVHSENPAMNDVKRSSPVLIGLAWLVVGVPLLWGVSQTLIKSLALFQ